jgi:hypothetical protein
VSSKDKTGQDDEKPEVDTEDHTQPDPARPDTPDGDDVAEAPQDTPETSGNKDFSEIEDAEFVDESDHGADDAAPDGPTDGSVEFVGEDVTPATDSALGGDPADPADTAPETLADAAANDTAAGHTPGSEDGQTDADTDGPADTASAGPAPDPEPRAPTPPPAATPAPQKSGGGFVPALLGGLVAAGVGFGTALYLGGDLTGDDDALRAAISEQADRLSGLEGNLDTQLNALTEALGNAPETDLGPQLDALGDRLAEQVGSVATRIDGLSGTIDTMQGGIAELENRLGALDDRLAAVNERLTAVEKRPLTESSETAQQAFAAYERDLEELRAALNDQQATNDQLAAELEQRAAAAQAEVDAAAQRAAELQAQAEEQARVAAEQAEARTRAAATREALVALDAALETGAPYSAPLQVLSESAEIPQPLADAASGGVASLPDLRDSFPPLARAALDASIRETVDDGMADRAVAFFRAQTGVRSLAPRDGDDPDAVLSRAEAALADGDLATTLSELGQLPPSGQQVLADWVARAEQRVAVTEAADALANTLLAN